MVVGKILMKDYNYAIKFVFIFNDLKEWQSIPATVSDQFQWLLITNTELNPSNIWHNR